jgi:hypothetical protein
VKRQMGALCAALCAALAIAACATAGHAATSDEAQSAVSLSAWARTPAASSWGKAGQVPGLAALAGAGDSGLNTLSCASPGNCSAGGFYQQTSRSEAFVVSQVHGRWTKAETVPGIVALNKNGKAGLTSVSCSSPGNCSAGGYYTSGHYAGGHAAKTSAFVVDEITGAWGAAREVPGLATLNTGGQAGISSVSCTSPGNCSAGGSYGTATGPACCTYHGFVVSEVKGVWGTARGVPGTAGVNAVSCASAGNCGAAGVRVLSEVNGVWTPARKVATPKGSTFGAARIYVISCAAKGACSAGGIGGKEARSVVVSQAGGVWGTARVVPGTTTLMTKSKSSLFSTLSCTSAGNCTGGGYAFRSMPEGSSTREFAVPYLVRQRAGVWGRAQLVPGIGALSKNGYATISAVSCPSAGSCAAAGGYTTSSYNPDGSGPGQAFVLIETNGRWGVPRDVTSSLGNDGPAAFAGLSCPAKDGCSAAGNYWHGQQQRAFVISQAG